MMYPFMVLDDKTEVVHSEAYDKDGIETIKVYFEQPVENGKRIKRSISQYL